MEWNFLFDVSREPDENDMEAYIGSAGPLWNGLRAYIETIYQVKSKTSFSKCSAQPGWNVKYQKSGKSLCTLYPMEGFFIALVVIGAKEESEAGAGVKLGAFTPYVSELYRNTVSSCGGRWLMIRVDDSDVLEDVKRLIAIRVKPKN